MKIFGKKTGYGVTGLAVVAAMGWLPSSHVATQRAKDIVDGFLIRHDLQKEVAYADLSASPLGTVAISGVTITLPNNAEPVRIKTLKISDLRYRNDLVEAGRIRAESTELPALAFARGEKSRNSMWQDFVALGYETVTLNADVKASLDGSAMTLESSGDARDIGSWSVKLGLGGINVPALESLAQTAMSANKGNVLGQLALAGSAIEALSGLTLISTELELDNSGVLKRAHAYPAEETPVDVVKEQVAAENTTQQMQLIKAGVAPSDAQAMVKASSAWENKGGTIKLKTKLNRPLPLITGNILTGNFFAFSSAAEFLAATKAEVSY
jgi:hypothetical protein